jgi:hypothetical protein
MMLKEIRWSLVDWIDQDQDRDRLRAAVDTVKNLLVP